MTRGSARVLRFIVCGRVQGVFFRASAARTAASLAITGWVKNLPDGSVEVVCAGSDSALDELAGWLWQGPSGADVTSVEVALSDEEVADSFEVR